MFSSNGGFEGGYSYSPYGEARSTSTTDAVTANVMRYISSPLDSSGLYKLGARYYDPATGRFTQFDPSGQESNPYAYAGCNPINAKDPTGLMCLELTVVGVGAVLVGEIVANVGATLVVTGYGTTVGLWAVSGGVALAIYGALSVVAAQIVCVVESCEEDSDY